MLVREKIKHILVELKGHAPFTLVGALLGVFFMLFFRNFGETGSRMLFTIFHPAHVILSATVTASMFELHTMKKRFLTVLIVGYFGSVGIATLSDIVIPHLGTSVFGLNIPSESEMHQLVVESDSEVVGEGHGHGDCSIHLGFIEEWYIVNPAALLGVIVGFFLPRTKFPHAGHILVSTWASSSYLLMNMQADLTIIVVTGAFLTLFIAVWLPCCISDIIFPLLFVKSDVEIVGPCPVHKRHSHPHVEPSESGR